MEYELELHIVVSGVPLQSLRLLESEITRFVTSYVEPFADRKFEVAGGVSKLEVPDGEETS